MISELKIIEWLNYFNEDLLLPIFLSFVAATIFWLVFDYFPRQRKYKKIRPKVEFDLYQMHFGLGFYFFKLFQVSPWRSVEHQHEIDAGLLTKEEIELWLQDKCLNDTYKFDENKDKLISIGKDLEHIALEYSERLNKVLNFIDYLSVEEVLLLQKIEYKLFTYDYKGNADSKIGEKKYYPVNPNLAYMTENIYELYQLYLALREIVLDYKLIDKNINKYILPKFDLIKVTDFYYRKEYTKCIRRIKKNKSLEDYWLLFQCLLKQGKKKKGYKILRELLSSTKLELVSIRNYLTPFILEDEQVINICKEIRNETELKYCLKVVHEEISLRAYYEKRNLALKYYYDNKAEGSTAKGMENYEKMKNNL
jgi:hypothetical protein